MSKSHYFVQRPPEEQLGGQIRDCGYCGKPFVPKRKDAVYCCPECRDKGTRKVKAEWFQRNKAHCNEKRKSNRRKHGMQPVESLHKHRRLRKVRNRVIKQELINLELMTFQIKAEFSGRKGKLDYRDSRRVNTPARCALIKRELEKLELYTEQIEAMDKKDLDFSQEYTGIWLF